MAWPGTLFNPNPRTTERQAMAQLKDGDLFPSFSAETIDGQRVTLPDDIPAGNYAIIIAYRAEW